MSWTDKQSVRVIKYLRDKYKIQTLVETGTFKGINARLHSKNFETILTCEKIDNYYQTAKENLKDYKNVICIKQDSPKFLHSIMAGNYMFYLDAHFYDPDMPKGKGKFIVLKELDNMIKFKNSVIIVHDFDNGLGHCTYDGVKLDMDLLRKKLKRINKNFKFYTNRVESCDIVKSNAEDIKEAGLEVDFDTLDNLDYAWTDPRLTYRGILYCLPSKLNDKELKELGLREYA